jgi:hypothetical protein
MSRDLDVPAQLDDVICVFRANKIARTSTTIRALLEKTGFGSIQSKRTYYLLLMKGTPYILILARNLKIIALSMVSALAFDVSAPISKPLTSHKEL